MLVNIDIADGTLLGGIPIVQLGHEQESAALPPSLWPASLTREVGSRDLLLFERASWRLLDTYRDTAQFPNRRCLQIAS